MQKTLRTMLKEIFVSRARHRKLVALVCVLSVLVVAGVFWRLTQPAITMAANPVCGMSEHSHTPACQASKLVCGTEEGESHTHASACFETVMVCGEKEHSHGDGCYPREMAEPSIAPTAAPTADPTPAPTATAEAAVIAEEEPTAAPTNEPTATAEPTAAPDVTAEPTVSPEVSIAPSVSPEASAEASIAPSVSPEASAEASIAPSVSPEASAEASIAPSFSPEASAEASIAPSVSPEASVEASIEPSVSPEVSVEPSAEPLPGMPVIAISAAQDAILAGETAVWNYEITDAANAVYTVSCDGAVVSEGTIEVPSGSISIAECAPGSLTAAITAQNELGEVSASASIRIAEKLQLDISCSALSCFDGDRVSFALTSIGGEAPVAYKITVRQGGIVTQEYNEFRDIIEVEAQSGGSVSALALEVEAVDALGNTFGASCEIPVAVNKRERPSAWADSVRTELSGDWTKDLVRVAKTQLGYRESEINFIVRKDGSRQGYTRYGDWYGLPYEEWCAMFASFCLNYADIPESEIPRNAGCARWINDLSSRGLYAKDSEYTPAAGDLVFFDWEHDGHSDHVGIVAEVSASSITTIEGNSGRSVRMCSYSINDSDIMGYGMVSRAYANLHPADDEGEDAPAVDDAQDSDPVHIEMWIEEGEEASTINMCAVLNGVNEEDFNWQWQRAQSPDGEWQDIIDTMGLECALPLNEENYFGYYRICGDYGVPMAAVYSLRALPEATEAAPAAIASAPESPSLRGIGVSGSQMTIDVYFINTANNLLNEYAAEYTASSSYSNFVDTGALFDELKTGAAGAELRNGSYATAYLGTSAENRDKEANYLRFYWSNLYYSQTETYAAPYISSGGNSDFEDYALYIHYTPAASDVKVTFYNRKDFGDSDRVREPHSFGSGKTLAEAGIALPETAPVDPSGMGRSFAGWFFTNDAGEEVELTEENIATVAFEADTAVYAVYSDAATYTVTFLDSEGGSVFEENEYTIAGGETLGSLFEYGELPWPPMDEYGEVEYRWYYRDENGDELPADPEMTVNSDLQIYAKQVGMYLVYIYDIDPDGTPVSPDPENGVESDDINILVPEGDIVADYFYDVFQDGTEYADINAWYSMDNEGNLHPFDPASAMPAHDLYLYTYSYRLGLLRDDDASGETLEIVAREGTPLNAADFIVNDVYYRTYKWTKEDGTALDLEALIADGLTENVSATGTLAAESAGKIAVNFYAFVDDERVLVKTVSTDRYTFADSGNRHYITVFSAEQALADFGFSADMVSDTSNSILPHTDVGSATLWPVNFKQVDGIWYIPTITHTGPGADVYYLPNGTVASGNFGYTSVMADNTFYSVTVMDPEGVVYPDEADIPPVQYVLKGETAEAEVWMADYETSAGWTVLDKAGSEVEFEAYDDYDYGTTVLTIENVSAPLIIMPALPEGQYYVKYDINLDGYNISGKGPVPNIMGSDTHTDTVETGIYDVHAPANPQFWVENGTVLNVFEFDGWRVLDADGNEAVIPAGEMDLSDLQTYAQGNIISLNAVWTQKTATAKLNFYVNRACRVLNADGTSVDENTNAQFTDAVYATSVTIDNPDHFLENWMPRGGSNDNELIVIQGKSDTDTAAADKAIRNLNKGDYTAVSSSEDATAYTIDIGGFPSDEFVFEQLRRLQKEAIENNDTSEQISLNNEVIPVEDLNSTNFTIRWYVFKYTTGDAHWHIDGVLVQKQGHLAIQKTFYGHEAAIEDVKQDFAITLTHQGETTPTYTLTLNDADTDTTTGYDYYDAASDTYTWVVTVKQNTEYNVKETGFQAESSYGGVSVATLAEYNIRNSKDSTGGSWLTYHSGSGVNVTATAYASDVDYGSYQTVSFLNSYIPTNTMIIRKVDAITGRGIANVSFTLQKEDAVHPVWISEDGSYYIYDPVNEGISVEKDESGVITTNASGDLVLIGLKDPQYLGSYSLTENAAPDGYNLIFDPIGFAVGADGGITITSGSVHAEMDESGMTMRIKNTPRSTQLIAEKRWLDEADAKPVTLRLYRNGAEMTGSAYTIELDGTEDTPWTYTWNEMPLFINGEAAQYSVREIWIGSSTSGGAAYDPSADEDGYADYVVTRRDVEYRFSDGSSGTSATRVTDGETEYAQMAILVVENDLYRGQLAFEKVDAAGEALPGAVFSVYENADDEEPLATAASNADGRVVFNLDAGTYYMRETEAPDGYISNDTLYQVTVSGAGAKIRFMQDDVWTELTDKKITNIRELNVTVAKVDGAGRPLPGAVFEIHDSEGSYLYDGANYSFSPDTSFILKALPDGRYTLEEVSAPAGYYRMDEIIAFTVEKGEITDYDLPVDADYDAESNTFTVTNVPGSMLPATGGPGTALFTAIGMLLMGSSLFVGLRIAVLNKKKIQKKEN